MSPNGGFFLTLVEVRTARRYSHDHSITSEVLSLVCPSLRVRKFKFMFVELMFFRFGLLY